MRARVVIALTAASFGVAAACVIGPKQDDPVGEPSAGRPGDLVPDAGAGFADDAGKTAAPAAPDACPVRADADSAEVPDAGDASGCEDTAKGDALLDVWDGSDGG